MTGAAGLSMDSLVEFDWEFALGGETIARADSGIVPPSKTTGRLSPGRPGAGTRLPMHSARRSPVDRWSGCHQQSILLKAA
jgi:hypothetical protein